MIFYKKDGSLLQTFNLYKENELNDEEPNEGGTSMSLVIKGLKSGQIITQGIFSKLESLCFKEIFKQVSEVVLIDVKISRVMKC